MSAAAPAGKGATAGPMSNGEAAGPHQQGFTYLALLFAVAIAGAVFAAIGVVWSQANQREKEAELLFVGNQFRQAIAVYYQRTPGTLKRYPQKIENLIEDGRYLATQRYLRKLYADPMTGKTEWGFVMAPEGGIMGVYSLSTGKPIKNAGFAQADEAAGFAKAASYADWRFAYAPINTSQAGPQPAGPLVRPQGPAPPASTGRPG